MEVIKGVVFDRGKKQLCCALVTDEQLTNIASETVIMGAHLYANDLTDAIQDCSKYRPPYRLGDITHTILAVSNMYPQDLEKVK